MQHRLSEVDRQARRAVCCVCGPTKIYVTQRKNGWTSRVRCAVKKDADQRRFNFQQRYGISIEAYEALLATQEGLCAICGRPPVSGPLHVDHCHTTNVVRGLLCFSCNSILGNAKDNPDVLRAAISYLGRQNAA